MFFYIMRFVRIIHRNIMNFYKENLILIKTTIQKMRVLINNITPTKKQLNWLSERRNKQELITFKTNIQLALNHGSTVIGYFDGYDARGEFQLQSFTASDKYTRVRLLDILAYFNWVLLELEQVMSKYILRENLVLCDNGPSKPGIQRTTEICIQHLHQLTEMTYFLILKITNSQDIKSKIHAYQNTQS